MGIFFLGRLNSLALEKQRKKIKELEFYKKLKKNEYSIYPNTKLYFEILNLKKQIDSIKLKLTKKGISKLRYEIN